MKTKRELSEQELAIRHRAKKFNTKASTIIVLVPVLVTLISYFSFCSSGAMKANAMTLTSRGEIVKSNEYVVLYLFTFIFYHNRDYKPSF